MAINELYGKPKDITELVVPILKGKVFIDEATREISIAPDVVSEKTRIKVLLYLLGKKVIKANFPNLSIDQYGTSAKDVIKPLYISKAQSDGAFNTLKNENGGIIDALERNGKEVLYHIPNHKVLDVVNTLRDNKN